MLEEKPSFKEFYPALCNTEWKVTSVEQYMTAIDEAYKALWSETQDASDIKYSPKLWYRGVRAFDYPLLPAIGRKDHSVEYETIFLSRFKSKAAPYLEHMAVRPASDGIPSYWDWLFLMHAYDVPTRLMDWSEDALVALVFAIDGAASEDEKAKDAAVWCLNPVMLNTAFTFHDFYPPGYIPNVQEQGVYELFGPFAHPFQNKKPAAVYGPLNNARMIVQRTTYTLFPFTVPLADMQELSDSSRFLKRIIIAREYREAITEQLRRYGIHKGQLMPELSSVAQEILQDVL